MLKYTIILMNMLALLVVRMFLPGDVTVKVNVPSQVKQGEEFTVSLTINKGSIAGVGHMKQELPAGLGNATIVESKGAEFKYLPEDNVVKFTWISLPAEQEFTVSYKVKVNADAAEGRINFAGKFSYVLNNEKQSFMVSETSVLVAKKDVWVAAATQPETTVPTTHTGTTTTTTQPETTTTSTTTVSAETKNSASITTSRIIVGSPEAGMEFTVEININKDGMKGFARIQEILPAGLTAMSLNNKGGTFSFIDQKVKIIWDNLPADEDVKVSYRVSVGDNVSGNLTITGSFSYVENDDPKKVDIASTTLSVKAKTALATANTTTENTNTTDNTAAAKNQIVTTAETTIPEPENKIDYKVQICALSKIQRGTAYFENKFTITNKVNMEFHEGWKKYIVGKYNQYKEARDYRESVRSKGVDNPFVTAYNGGKRITVQEALMISNQQWLR